MKKKIYSLLIGVLIAIAAFAEDRDTPLTSDSIPMSYEGEDIVIVAFKENMDITSQPISANLLSGKELNERNITTIKDLSAFIPNFFMPDYGSKLKAPLYIRGIGSQVNAPSVGLYVDGIPYFDRSSFDFNLNEIERIEILRGPQGTIYGRNTMGGVINVYTKSPFKKKESNVNLSAGSYDNYKIGASHIGNINNTFGYSFSGSYLKSGGYFDNIYTGKKADGMDVVTGRIRLGWIINPELNAYLTSAYEYSDQNGYPYGIYDAERRNKVKKVNYNCPSFYRRNMSNNGLTLEHTTARFKLSSQSSFQYFDGKQGIDQDFTPDDKYYVNFTHRQQMYSQEINIKSVRESFYKWQFGVFGFHQKYNQTNDVENRQLKKETITNIDNPTLGFALYHQSTLNKIFLEGLSATFGIRYDWERTKMKNNTTLIDTLTSLLPAKYAKDIYTQVTPKFSLQYNLTSDNLVYFSVSKGYKAGGFNTTVEKEKDRIFKPEHSWNYEIGTKLSCLNKTINTDISLFYIDWTDQQISQKRATEQGFKIRNAGKSVSKGLEITTNIFTLKNLDIQLNYGYTHAKFKDYLYDETKMTNYKGNFLPFVPRNTFSAAVKYNILTNYNWLDKISFNAQYIGIGKLYWNDNNKSVQDYYNTVNAKASFIKKGLTIDLWAKNITNEKYITYYFESMGNKFAQQSKPFSFGADINIKF